MSGYSHKCSCAGPCQPTARRGTGSEPCCSTHSRSPSPSPQFGPEHSSHDTHRSSARWSSHIQPRFSWKKGKGTLSYSNRIVSNLHPTVGQCNQRATAQIWLASVGLTPSVPIPELISRFLLLAQSPQSSSVPSMRQPTMRINRPELPKGSTHTSSLSRAQHFLAGSWTWWLNAHRQFPP